MIAFHQLLVVACHFAKRNLPGRKFHDTDQTTLIRPIVLIETFIRPRSDDCDRPARIRLDQRSQILSLAIVMIERNGQRESPPG